MQEQEVADTQEDGAGLLLELIQQHELLYNLKHKDYKNNKKKMEAWGEIALMLNSTGKVKKEFKPLCSNSRDNLDVYFDECQRIWKTLRDKFTREKRRQCKSGSATPESQWVLFPKMVFYEKYTKPRPTYTNTSRPSSGSSSRPASANSLSSGCSILSTPLTSEAVLEVQETEGLSEDGGDRNEYLEPGPSSTQITPKSHMGPKLTPLKPTSNAKRKADEELELLKVAKSLATSVQMQQQHANNTNKTFVDYIYSVLTNMPAERAKEVRKKILQILLEEETN